MEKFGGVKTLITPELKAEILRYKFDRDTAYAARKIYFRLSKAAAKRQRQIYRQMADMGYKYSSIRKTVASVKTLGPLT